MVKKVGNTDIALGQIVNVTELANMLGTSRQNITRWVGQGCPVFEDKTSQKGRRYDSAAVIRWLRDRALAEVRGNDEEGLPIEEIRRRKELAQMKKEEISLAVEEERFGSVEAILRELGDALSTIRANLIAMPKFAAQLEHQDALVIEKRLEEEIYRILDELSDFVLEDDDE